MSEPWEYPSVPWNPSRERQLGFDVSLDDSPTHQSSPADWRLIRREQGGALTYAYVGSTEGWYKAPPCEGRAPSTDGDVYILHAPAVRRVKIGVSSNVTERVATLRTASPVELVLERTIDGGYDREQELHEKYRRYRLHGEWFSDEILKLLDDE